MNLLAAPVRGIPALPMRAEQGYAALQGQREREAATLWFALDPASTALSRVTSLRSAAFGLVHDPAQQVGACPSLGQNSCFQAQLAVGRWLLRQAGARDIETLNAPGDEALIAPAVERFAALSPEAQRAWLVAHFADLRAGRLTLEDLP